MNKTLTDDLKDIVKEEGVKTGASALLPYIDAKGKSTELVRVVPRDAEDALEVMEFAAAGKLNVFSVRSRYLPDGLDKEKGLLIDPAALNQVKNVDTRNMMAYIGAGTTFEQILPELDKAGMKLLMPACAESPYIVRSYLDRDILVGAMANRAYQLSIFHAVLADGRLWVSGSQQMADEGHADFREDQGPQLSPFFGASEDIYGIPVYGVVYIYPAREERRVLAFGFNDLKPAVDFSYKVCREDHCFEIAGGDATFWSVMAGAKERDALRSALPPWTVLISIEHHRELVELQAGIVSDDAGKMGGKPLGDDLTSTLGSLLGKPWYRWDRDYHAGATLPVTCYNFSNQVADALTTNAQAAEAQDLQPAGHLFIPVYFGGAFYCESDLYYAPEDEEKATSAWRDAYASILKQGYLVDRPKGELARMVFAQAKPSYLDMIKRMKRILDPEGRLNPGQLLEGI
ncbi:MAG: FAD-binding oxidoreductase [Methanomassiliicoccales archaeon]|nr:FAD-binding oxidoreductase [Methanomassiliicoccales archaeon]